MKTLIPFFGALAISFMAHAAAPASEQILKIDQKNSSYAECMSELQINTASSESALNRQILKQTVTSGKALQIEEISSGTEEGDIYLVKMNTGGSYRFPLWQRVVIKTEREGNKLKSASVETQALNLTYSAEIAEGDGICVFK